MESVSRRRWAAALLATVTLVVAGCGGGDGGSTTKPPAGDESLSATPTAQATAAAPADAKVISVTVKGDSVTPSGTRVSVKRNQPVVFEIQADTGGELHVHSTPAKAIEYPAGASRVQIAIDQPGIIEVEIEQIGKQVVQLEVK
ncbi:MAG TPA: hypothetical protein VHO29_09035 [Marmoricola sp.]|nr:hypothetical protein [Marmoricola sp.]